MTISVVIPTYRRPESLHNCLTGLRRQVRPADQVVVVMQSSDLGTAKMLEGHRDWTALQIILCSTGGAVSQYNAGLEASCGDLVAITDDDSIAKVDWLHRIEQHFFANPALGGVGGRDRVHEKGRVLEGHARVVGQFHWYGRFAGNHHIGSLVNTDVDVLKGVNMAFRREAIGATRFDTDLRGEGAQTCLDMAFSLSVQKRGWRLLYDPDVCVDHFPAPRFDHDQRGAPSPLAIENHCFNYYLTIRRYMRPGFRRTMALTWAWLIGSQSVPGLIRNLLNRAGADEHRAVFRSAAKRAWRSAKIAEP